MKFVTGGATRTDNGDPITNKKELKALVKEDPYFVTFFSTSDHGPQFDGPLNKLPQGITLVVVGPDPYRNRRWYANLFHEARNPDSVKVT